MPLARLLERTKRAIDANQRDKSGKGHHLAAGLHLLCERAPTEFEASIYEPVVCLILQGEKVTTIGEQARVVSAGKCIVVSHDLPVLARVTKASDKHPYLAVVIELDLTVLRSLYDEVDHRELETASARSMEIAPIDPLLEDVASRYLDLLGDPLGARVLLPLVRKELHFRLFLSKPGGMLRSLMHRDSNESNIARAIKTLRADHRRSWDIAELAKSVGMSASAFHKHFKAVTTTTPLQYQKELRLTEARRLLRAGPHSVSSAAFAVGYESASQFSREYARKFGRPPSADLQVA
ncbi:MAG TPA: AraC family transcriptional regulator [Polyangiaceae bacterium]